jgi:hypothetical protein
MMDLSRDTETGVQSWAEPRSIVQRSASLGLLIASGWLLTGCDPVPAARDEPGADASISSGEDAQASADGERAGAGPSPSRRRDALPSEVTIFIQRRDTCDRLRGEDAVDDAHAAELARKLDEACAGTDAQLADLRGHHANNPAVMTALGRYDAGIE